ncbi:MAG TPA: 3-phosphoshikimate 1-carboxyvinyltransferase [Sandaracinaceae bacterium LLY-WYZ-13_1]|nr:3-phosphoshikimate 1-carboxyvinyltransferase [Sandaracinaceae bacterium LLY-WYZ-13_1]
MTRRYRIRAGRPLRGVIRVPGDKSIGHRSLIFASLAEGRSTVTGLSGGLDNLATAQVFRDMGVRIAIDGTTAEIDGVGLDGLRMPSGDLDCGNSGTTMRLVAGILAGQRFGTRLVGDASLSRRPMRRIVEPLRARGAHVGGVSGPKEGEVYPPLSVAPLMDDETLIALEYSSPVASAQVKSCLLLSGLWARGLTAIAEPVVSRDHTERMMEALGVPVRVTGPMVLLDPSEWDRRWGGFEWEVPGDVSSAAFPLVAALMVPGSEVRLEGVGVNPTRTGLLDVLRTMRADLSFEPKGDRAGQEPVADLVVRHGGLSPAMTAGELLTRMIDEVPAFCAVATVAGGRSDVRDAQELRVKESDRLETSARVLKAFGADCTELQDGMHVHGGARLVGAEVDSGGDHRIAMMAAVLGMAAEGETVVRDVACVDTSFPGFAARMAALGADIVEEEAS